VKYKPYKTIKDYLLEDNYVIVKINEKEIAVESSSYNLYEIRIYNWVDFYIFKKRCTHVLKGHKSFIRCLILSEDKTTLFSGSADKTIKIWNLSNYTCIKTLEGHSTWVNIILLFRPGLLCSVSLDSLIKFWDIESGKCIHTLHGHKDYIR